MHDENVDVLHLPRVNGVLNSPNSFDLDPLAFDLRPLNLTFVTLTLTLVTLTLDHLFRNYAKNWNFYIFGLGDLDLDL